MHMKNNDNQLKRAATPLVSLAVAGLLSGLALTSCGSENKEAPKSPAAKEAGAAAKEAGAAAKEAGAAAKQAGAAAKEAGAAAKEAANAVVHNLWTKETDSAPLPDLSLNRRKRP